MKPGRVRLMRNSGGIMSADEAARFPARAVFSGPAGGVQATAKLARALGERRIAALDMGGTSADISVVLGELQPEDDGMLNEHPLRMPLLPIETIGAGGGSLAGTENGDALYVGPQSAGAEPGPACYGRGSGRPTVTDANCHLGRIDAGHFLDGRMQLDAAAAADAVWRHVAAPLGLALDAAAEGILRIVLTKTAIDGLAGNGDPELAAHAALAKLDRVQGRGGLILVNTRGRVAVAFNTPRMARGWVEDDGILHVAVEELGTR